MFQRAQVVAVSKYGHVHMISGSRMFLITPVYYDLTSRSWQHISSLGHLFSFIVFICQMSEERHSSGTLHAHMIYDINRSQVSTSCDHN